MIERTPFSEYLINSDCQLLNLVEPRPLAELVEVKRAKGLGVSLVLPTFNEETTIGGLIDSWSKLCDKKLIDEIIVVDSGSEDKTEEEVTNRQVPFFKAAFKLQEMGLPPVSGKGTNVWLSQFLTSGEILVFADADMENPTEQTVVNLVSPLILDDQKMLAKSIFKRETRTDEEKIEVGGRVTELVAKPALKLLFPQLAGVAQPLNGNIAVRREALKNLSLGAEYQVDLQILLGVFLEYGPQAIAQVECGSFRQKGNGMDKLSLMSRQVLKVVLETAAKSGRLALKEPLPEDFTFPPVRDLNQATG